MDYCSDGTNTILSVTIVGREEDGTGLTVTVKGDGHVCLGNPPIMQRLLADISDAVRRHVEYLFRKQPVVESSGERPRSQSLYGQLLDKRADMTHAEFLHGCEAVVNQGYVPTMYGAAGGYEYECSDYYAAKAHLHAEQRRMNTRAEESSHPGTPSGSPDHKTRKKTPGKKPARRKKPKQA